MAYRRIILFVAMAALYLSVTSCQKEMQVNIRFFLKYDGIDNYYYTANSEYLNFSIEVDRNQSTPKLSVSQIEVFLGDVKIAENQNNDRLDVTWKVNDQPVGKQKLLISITGSVPGYSEVAVSAYSMITVMKEKPVFGFDLKASDVWHEGEKVNISIEEVAGANLHLSATDITYLVDGDQIGSSKSETETVSYTVPLLSKEQHTLTAVVECRVPEDNISTLLTVSKEITIQ